MAQKYGRQKSLMQEKEQYLKSHGYSGKITQQMLRYSWDDIKKISSGSVSRETVKQRKKVSHETKRPRKVLTPTEKTARSKRKYERQKKLMEEKRKMLEEAGYEGKITQSLLRKSWKELETGLIGDRYMVVFFGDKIGEADPSFYSIFYQSMTFEECMADIEYTMTDRGLAGSKGYPGHVEVHKYRERRLMEEDIEFMRNIGYQVIASGNVFTKIEMARTIAFAVDMSTEDNRPFVLRDILKTIAVGFPWMENDFIYLKKYCTNVWNM